MRVFAQVGRGNKPIGLRSRRQLWHRECCPDGAREGNTTADSMYSLEIMGSVSMIGNTYMYIQRHPASPLEPFKPAWTAAIRNPENSGPTEVNTWIKVLRRASSWGL